MSAAANYGRAVLEAEARTVATARVGERNQRLNRAAFSCGQLIGAGGLVEDDIVSALERAAADSGLTNDDGISAVRATIKSGLAKGQTSPREIPLQNGHDRVRHGAAVKAKREYVAATPKEFATAPEEFPSWTAPGDDGRPKFHRWDADGPRVHDRERQRHVYKRGGVAVRIKIRNGDGNGPRFVDWYRVTNDRGKVGWQARKPRGFRDVPYCGVLDPFDPELEGDTLYWPEGEKDVDNLTSRGLPAITFGGASNFPEGAELFCNGRHVAILADNDAEGAGHAEEKAARCAVVASSVKVVHFRELAPKGDVSDFFERGANADDLQQRVEECPLWPQPESGDPLDTQVKGPTLNLGAPSAAEALRPTIRIKAGHLPDLATAGESAIIATHMPIYSRGKALVRPVVEEVEAARGHRTYVTQLASLDMPYLRDLLCRAAHWEKFDCRKKAWIAADVPNDVAQTILCRFGEWTFPPTLGVLTTPTLRPDGSLLATPGYDPQTRMILIKPPPMPSIAANPTREDAERALGTLAGLLKEFSFVDEASRSVGLSALITPVVRAAFPVTPMHAANAPTSGSGKSYLIEVAAAIVIGQPCPVMAAGRTEEETEKRLGAALLAGRTLVSIDNVNGELGGDALCQAIERHVLEIRVLGKSELFRIEARGTTIFATGNNLTLVGDMTRRAIICTLDPGVERPELRQFTCDPVADVLADRGKYVAAAITVVLGYIAAGRPDLAPRLASFEGWSDTVRSALIWLGCADPVITMEQARAKDPRLIALRDMLLSWSQAIGTGQSTRRTAAAVLTLIEQGKPSDGKDEGWRYQGLHAAVLNVAISRGRIEARTFGRWVVRNRGRIVDGLRFADEPDEHGHGSKWWVEKC